MPERQYPPRNSLDPQNMNWSTRADTGICKASERCHLHILFCWHPKDTVGMAQRRNKFCKPANYSPAWTEIGNLKSCWTMANIFCLAPSLYIFHQKPQMLHRALLMGLHLVLLLVLMCTIFYSFWL